MPEARDKLLAWYRMMLLIRRFEETVEELFSSGSVKGTTHPSIGQEAIAVGACSVLRRGDCVTSNHRGHSHFLACGGDPQRMMAELFGKVTGYSAGRGGSQLMADYALGFLGGNGITGGSIPVATGVALAMKKNAQSGARHNVVLCFFGDGASNQGTFHESLNMAGLWKLPVVYVCENNQYAMSTHVRDAVPVPAIAVRAAGYGMPGVTVDGNDLFAVRAAMSTACARARLLKGPTLVECVTYRLSGHSRGDPRRYRTREEEAAARQRGPLRRCRKALRDRGVLDAATDARLQREVRKIVAASIKFAQTSPDPAADRLETGLFA